MFKWNPIKISGKYEGKYIQYAADMNTQQVFIMYYPHKWYVETDTTETNDRLVWYAADTLDEAKQWVEKNKKLIDNVFASYDDAKQQAKELVCLYEG